MSSTSVEPVNSGKMRHMFSPAIQNSGKKLSDTACGSGGASDEFAAAVYTMSRWVWTQPFGMPVVPPV